MFHIKQLFFLFFILYSRKETDTLRQQLHSERLQTASLEEQLRNALQDMARQVFEMLFEVLYNKQIYFKM